MATGTSLLPETSIKLPLSRNTLLLFFAVPGTVSGKSKGLSVSGFSTALNVTCPPVAMILLFPSIFIWLPTTSTREGLNCWASGLVAVSFKSGNTSVTLPSPSVTVPVFVALTNLSVLPLPLARNILVTVSLASKRIEPFAFTEVVAVILPCWFTANPIRVALPRSAKIVPKFAAVPPLSTSTSKPRKLLLNEAPFPRLPVFCKFVASSIEVRYTLLPAARIVCPSGVVMTP